ncbi:MAG: hypothetical protein AB7V42_16110 [Thermoleophilia bacterium]
MRCEQLCDEIAGLDLDQHERIRVEVRHGSYQEEVGPFLDDLDGRGRRLAPTFAFIDPFGYDANPLAIGGRILAFEKCEILFYVPLPFIARFINSDSVLATALPTPSATIGGKGRRVAPSSRQSKHSTNSWSNLSARPASTSARSRSLVPV